MSLVAESSPPGVSSSMINASAPSFALVSTACWRKSEEAGFTEPSMRIRLM
jgi:hypothetical protein